MQMEICKYYYTEDCTDYVHMFVEILLKLSILSFS